MWILSKTNGRAEISQETFMIICTEDPALSVKISSGKYAVSRSNSIGRRENKFAHGEGARSFEDEHYGGD